jgi:hypothetical protein
MHVCCRFQVFYLALLLPIPYAVAQTSAAPAQTTKSSSVLTFDGGTRQTLESIFIPPMAHAPFSLTLETEWVRPLGNGGTYTVANKRKIMRDSAGRIYQERWLLVPKNGKMESKMDYIQISDPAEHTLYNCERETKQATCCVTADLPKPRICPHLSSPVRCRMEVDSPRTKTWAPILPKVSILSAIGTLQH